MPCSSKLGNTHARIYKNKNLRLLFIIFFFFEHLQKIYKLSSSFVHDSSDRESTEFEDIEDNDTELRLLFNRTVAKR
jgi:hypothetical protein